MGGNTNHVVNIVYVNNKNKVIIIINFGTLRYLSIFSSPLPNLFHNYKNRFVQPSGVISERCIRYLFSEWLTTDFVYLITCLLYTSDAADE